MSVSADSTGARIAAYRTLHHLTQRALADRAHVSYSLLTKVESGARPASPGLIAACARALGADVSRLTGQPYRPGRDGRLLGLLGPVRTALDLYDLPPVLDTPPRALSGLRPAV